jgi:hypothetical protein
MPKGQFILVLAGLLKLTDVLGTLHGLCLGANFCLRRRWLLCLAAGSVCSAAG